MFGIHDILLGIERSRLASYCCRPSANTSGEITWGSSANRQSVARSRK
jgi:hypothetical protein